MELMMCGGLFTITYENSAESIPLLLFGQSKGTSQNCTKLCPIKTRPTLSIKHKLSPSLHSYDGDDCTFSLTRFFFSLSLWMRERGGECEYDPAYQMCHNRADWCFRLSIPSHWQAVSCWLPRRSSPVRAGAHQSQSRVSGEHAHRLFDEIWQQMSQRRQNSCCLRDNQTHSVFLNYDNAKQCHPNHRGRVSIFSLLPSDARRLPPHVIISFRLLSDKNVSGSTKNTRWGGRANRERKGWHDKPASVTRPLL